jgi:hypothetical protein
LWKTRDCRVPHTTPTEESFKEFTKCLKLILRLVQLFPTKTLESELLCFVGKQNHLNSPETSKTCHQKGKKIPRG